MFWRSGTSIREWLPRLQAHRGYWFEGLQQNSLGSVKEAFKRGYKMAEFDVRLTSDQVAVLFHDEKYQDLSLFRSTYDNFKTAIAKEFPELSCLEDVFIWMKTEIQKAKLFDFKLNIEIKSNKIFESRLEDQILKLIEKHDLIDRILISSFNPFTLFRVRKFDSRIWRALLITHSEESNFLLNKMLFNFLAKPDVLHIRWIDLDAKILKKVAGRVPVVLWTVNSLADIEKFTGKIHGIISDQITPQEFQDFKTDKV